MKAKKPAYSIQYIFNYIDTIVQDCEPTVKYNPRAVELRLFLSFSEHPSSWKKCEEMKPQHLPRSHNSICCVFVIMEQN